VRSARHHLESLDAFRGITIAGMIVVNNPGNWERVYAPLLHADWNGCTLADLVYPFFIVILGVALPFALNRRRASGHEVRRLYVRFARRAVLLFGLGFLLNLVAARFSFATVRVPGVLQRIAIVYFFAAAIALHLKPHQRAGVAIALLAAHTLLLALAPMTPTATVAARIDRAVFGAHTLTPIGPDPEGVLGTLTAITSALICTLAGDWLRRESAPPSRIAGLLAGGGTLVVAGYAWSFVLPLNKPLWTGSYVLFTGGLAIVCIAISYAIIDVLDIRTWARPFVWLGVNPLAIYFLAEFVGHLLESTGAKTWLYWTELRTAVTPPLGEAQTSLLFAVLTIVTWTIVAGVMYRRGVRVQV